jgi:tRNA U34 5-methylaminomethyl-2-thiouridine-forming methyltransferase MnmC
VGQPIQHTTSDGSDTLISGRWGVAYHSIHGALTESTHVFIRAGLDRFVHHQGTVNILEAGFGTGLNALLSLLWAEQHGVPVRYTALDIDPVPVTLATALNYPAALSVDAPKAGGYFAQLHEAPWGQSVALTDCFEVHKSGCAIEHVEASDAFHLVYYDAFAPEAQPELWTGDVFTRMFQALKPGGLLVTYCAKGIVKRHMRSAGFAVERLPGPPGKREMTRAHKPIAMQQL